jgi:MFS family permease
MLGDLLEGRSAQRGQRMGWVRGISSAGFGLTAFTAGKIADTFQINVPFYISAALLAVAFVLAVNIKEQRFAPTAGLPPFDWHTAWRSFLARFEDAWGVVRGTKDLEGDETTAGIKLPLAPLLVSSFLFSLMMGSVYGVWANYMKNVAGFSTTLVTVLWATASISEFPLMILAGWLSDRVGRLPLMGAGFLLWALVISSYIFVPIMPWIVVIQLTRGFAFSAVTASAMAYAAEARGRSQRGQVAGIYGAAGGVGSILGAATGGTLAQWAGFGFMFGVAAAAMLAGAIYFLVVYMRQRRVAAALLAAQG